jgi:hypothetical protein
MVERTRSADMRILFLVVSFGRGGMALIWGDGDGDDDGCGDGYCWGGDKQTLRGGRDGG